ncbi:MAG: flagellar M-ring protein FliF [Firmicutes bacterium HGW-Firmicutes-2]|jgi:flagellar M-ring protein FliF|nr:MAG: flagellar M-ring protein FliF [Firmicutes bacterium HGW-Firmicutes-2]
MPEFITNFSNQITEYWNKFTRTQKIQIIGIFLASIAALVILAVVLSRPNMIIYADNLTPDQMTAMVEILTANNIAHRYEDNASTLYVDSRKFQDAKLLLFEQGILSATTFQWKEAFNTSLTTSSDDRAMMQQLAFENELGGLIELIDKVKSARVKIVLPDTQRFVLQQDKVASASVILTTNGELTEDQVYGIASFVETAVDNLSIGNIKILDSNAKLLFNGSNDSSIFGSLNSHMDYRDAYEAKYERTIESLLLARGEFDDAVVGVNLKIDFDSVSSQSEVYSIAEGETEPYPTRVYIYESTGTSTDAGGIPGTDTNADTPTYPIDGGGGSESEVFISDKDLVPNSTITKTVRSIGNIIPEDSTVTVTLNKYIYHRQALLEEQGALEDTTWEQYQEDNSIRNAVEVDPNIVQLIANASNIDEVFVMAYEVPVFVDTPIVESQVADYIPVIIIILMIALLGYAVYKGTEPVEITEVEPELSVEDMLATTKSGDELEAIEYDGKSEARVQIERFVDENPDAVAQLLRNWLNEDWE